MAADTYYRPYLESDDELSDADSSDGSYSRDLTPRPDNAGPDLTPFQDLPDFAALARALQAPPPEASGPSFVTEEQELAYGTNQLNPRATYGPAALQDLSGSITTTSTDRPSVIMLQSQDRDHQLFPDPTNCSLFLPRVYKNVKGFTIAQLNLVSAFFYFRQAKENLEIMINESDRVQYPLELDPPLSGSYPQLNIINSIREGSYNIDTLLAEITTQLNRTPLFYDFLNGFSDFYQLFVVNGDFSINFNFPGDTYYDALTQTFIPNPTRLSITQNYFQSQYASQTSFTLSEVQVAYYYPVLKEAVLNPQTDFTLWNLTYPGYTQQELIQYIIYNFQGIDDPIITSIVSNAQNELQLDLYRLQNTFRYYLVNKYVCTYDTYNNRVVIQTTQLNTSLVTLLNTEYNVFLAQQLQKYNITAAQYNALTTTNVNLLSVVQSMYDYIQTQFARFYAINFGQYSRSYYAVSTNTVLLRPGLDASGVSLVYNPQITPISNDIFNQLRANPPNYFPNLRGLGGLESTVGPAINMGAAGLGYPASCNVPYIISASNIDNTRNFIDLDGTVYTDERRRAGDILATIEPYKYTVFRFTSRFRQTLQVETLSRPTYFRYPGWNNGAPTGSNFDKRPLNSNLSIFDASYNWFTPSTTTDLFKKTIRNLTISTIYGWSNPVRDLTVDFSTLRAQGGSSIMDPNGFTWSSNNWSVFFPNTSTIRRRIFETININSSNGKYYRFKVPQPFSSTVINGVSTSQLNALFRYPDFNLTVANFAAPLSTNTGFATDLTAFVYQDIGAFAADTTQPRDEEPMNYKFKMDLPAGTVQSTLIWTSYHNQDYFVIVRPNTISPATTNYVVVPWFKNPLNNRLVSTTTFDPNSDPLTLSNLNNCNIAMVADSNFIHFPINISTGNPPDYPINQTLAVDAPYIGYDRSNVSNDKTDYVPFLANDPSTFYPPATVLVDPVNNYIFQCNSPYCNAPNVQSYFYSGGSNALLLPEAIQEYTWIKPTGLARQSKLVQYYGPTFYADDLTPTYISLSTIQPYTSTVSGGKLDGYFYSNAYLQLNRGIAGITFAPGDGIFGFDRFTFKTAYTTTNSNFNENESIQIIGVFLASAVNNVPIGSINLCNAVAVCPFYSKTVYDSSGTLNIGFDGSLGIYYSFSNVSSLVVQSTQVLQGFLQTSGQYINDITSFYTAIPFSGFSNFSSLRANGNWTALKSQFSNSNVQPTFYRNLVGSPIPYPYAAEPIAVPAPNFFSPTHGYVSTSVADSNSDYGPPQFADATIVQYERSIPYVNSHIQYTSNIPFITNTSSFQPWSNVPTAPTQIIATVPNTMLFQDGVISIAEYSTFTQVGALSNSQRTFFYTGSFTPDVIYPLAEQTSLVAIAGTSSNYIFLGASNDPATPQTYQLRFKTYNPATGVIAELPINSNYRLETSLQVESFVVHNSGRWFLSAGGSFYGNPQATVLIGDAYYSTGTNRIVKSNITGVTNTTALAQDPTGYNLYYAQYNSNDGFSSFTAFNFLTSNGTGFDAGYITSNGAAISIIPGIATPSTFTSFMASLTGLTERIFLTNPNQDPNNFYGIYTYQSVTSNTTTITCNATLIQSVQGLSNPAARIYTGANGGKWYTALNAPYVYGNRNDAFDAPETLETAWQLFYPTMKIEMRKLSNAITPIIDTTGILYPEWPHTVMFGYDSFAKLSNDILGPVGSNQGRWGNERNSNFVVSDISFNGFYFNAYVMDFPLQSNYGEPSTNHYYLAIRGYSPTEGFQTLVRFYMPNRIDFGFLTFEQIATECSTVAGIFATGGSISNYNPTYFETTLLFNSNFVYSNITFGANVLTGYLGSNISSINFGDTLRQYINLYYTWESNVQIINEITSTVAGNMSNFITTELKYILPSTSLLRQRFTDPLPFSILWETNLTPNFRVLTDDWGLGWNLGYEKSNTPYGTVQRATSFYKIQQEFVYLRLSPEYNINGMDAGGKEDYRVSRDPTGTLNQYYCKMLLTTFGGNATTFIHNPINFNPPLNKLSKLTFQWVDGGGNAITNNDAEWNMTISLTERYDLPTIPDRLPFTPMDPRTMGPAPLPSSLQVPNAQELTTQMFQREQEFLVNEQIRLRAEAAKRGAVDGN